MESSLEWLRKIGVNLKKIYDAILDSTFGLPAIKQAIDDIVIDFRPITDKIDQSTEEIINKIETTQPDLSAVAKEDTLVTGITNINNNVDSQANAVTSTISSKTENIIGTVNDQANAVIDTVNSQAENVINNVNTSTTNVVEGKAGAIIDTVNAQGQNIKGSNDDATNTAILSAVTNIDFSALAKQGTNSNTSLTVVDDKIDDFYDTFDADIALQLQGIIGDTEESVGGNSQTVTEVERLRTLQESYDALSDDLQLLSSNLQTMVNKRNQLGEYVFDDNFAANSISDVISHRYELVSVRDNSITKLVGPCFSNCMHLQSIDLPNLIEITYVGINNDSGASCFNGDGQLRVINLPNLTHISGWNNFSNLTNLEVLELPNLLVARDGTYLTNNCLNLKSIKLPSLRVLYNGQAFWNCPELRELYIPNIDSNADYHFLNVNIFNVACTKVIDITIGRYIQKNFSLSSWNPTEALLTISQSLLTSEDIAKGFTSNREKLLYNIREHIAALLPDRTGLTSLTMTVSANIKAAINGDTATANAFANKNWIIA